MAMKKGMIYTDYLDKRYLGKITNYPAGFHILIDPLTKDEYNRVEGGKTTKGGIFIPDTAKGFDRAQMQDWRGIVVALGPLAYRDFVDGTLWCGPGDEILFARNAGKHVYDPLLDKVIVYLLDKDVVGQNTIIPPGWTQEQYDEELRKRDEQ